MAFNYMTGVVDLTSGSTTVTGTGTLWSTVVVPGDIFECSGLMGRIASVTDTSLDLVLPWAGETEVGAAYAITFSAPSRAEGTYVAERARELIERQRILADGVAIYAAVAVGVDAPPETPAADDLYVVGAEPTGAWAGYAGYLAVATDAGGWRFVPPEQGMHVYDLATDAIYARTATTWSNAAGLATPGANGWSPRLAIVADGARRVHQVPGWIGGEGSEPTGSVYVGATGFVDAIEDAVDIRGPAGADGHDGIGTGDMLKSAYDPDEDGVIAISNGGTGASSAEGARTSLELGDLATKNSVAIADLDEEVTLAFSPGVKVLAYAVFKWSTPNVVVDASFNAAITRSSTGVYVITMASAAPNANYAVVGIAPANYVSSVMIDSASAGGPAILKSTTQCQFRIAYCNPNATNLFDPIGQATIMILG